MSDIVLPSNQSNSRIEDNSHRTDEGPLRAALKAKYVARCDQCNVDPSPGVVHWLTHDPIDEPRIVGPDSCLSIVKKVHPITGTMIEGDPIVPLLDMFRLVPISHVSLENAHLHRTQVEKLLTYFLSDESSRSLWTMASLILYGNQVDASTFPLLLRVIERHPLLTIVRVDPSPQCHLSQMEQLCASNDAKCRHSFVHRKREELFSKRNAIAASAAELKFEKAVQQRLDVVPATAAASMALPSPRALLESAAVCSSTNPMEYELSISSFLGAIKSWAHFFYGPSKPLPDAMFYFLVTHTLESLRTTSSSMELIDELKVVEKRFVHWREGNYAVPQQSQTIERVVQASTFRCAHCDEEVNVPDEGWVGSAREQTTSTQSNFSKTIIDILLMESEVGSRCFVQNTSGYLRTVFKLLLERFSPPTPHHGTFYNVEDRNFDLPPRFCARGAKCIKRFCRSLFCSASGFMHGVQPLPNAHHVPKPRHDSAGVVSFDVLYPSFMSEVKPDPERLYEQYAIHRRDGHVAILSNQPIPKCMSTVTSLQSIIEKHIPHSRVCMEQLCCDPTVTSESRFPTHGQSLECVYSHLPRRGIAVESRDGGDVATLAPTMSLHMHWAGNLPRRPSPFVIMREYFLVRKKELNGSDVVLGVKLRPDVFNAIKDPTQDRNAGILALERVGTSNKRGMPVALHVHGVALLGKVWYLVASYHNGRLLYLDEDCVNKGARKYGAYAFVDCSFNMWLSAMRTTNPEVIRSIQFPLDLLERSIEVEDALRMMLHIDAFYESPSSFAYRSTFSLVPHDSLHTLRELGDIISSRGFVPTQHGVNESTIMSIIKWYRSGNLGRLAHYWGHEAPSLFREVVLAAARRIFSRAPPDVHGLLQPFHLSERDKKMIAPSAPFLHPCPWIIPTFQQEDQRFYTSGMLLARDPTVLSPFFDILEQDVDLSYLQSASTSSSVLGGGHRRYITLELCSVPLRVSRAEIVFRCGSLPPAPRSAVAAMSDQSGLLFTIAFSDDGKLFHECASSNQISLVRCEDECGKSPRNPRTATAGEPTCQDCVIDFGNVGAHRWWSVGVEAVNANNEALSRESFVYPTITTVGLRYISDVSPPLVVDYSREVVVVAPLSGGSPSSALVVSRPTSCNPSSRKVQRCSGGQVLRATDLLGTGNGYLSGAASTLGGQPGVCIAYESVIFCFRNGNVAEIERHSGQVRTPASAIDDHPICAFFPTIFKQQLTGGFQYPGKRLLLFNATHLCVFSTETLSLVLEPTSWRNAPGRQLVEVDAHGVATRTQLLNEDAHDPYTQYYFPFPEVEWCFPLFGGSSTTGEGDIQDVMIGAHDECIRWQIQCSMVASIGNGARDVCSRNGRRCRTLLVSEAMPPLTRRIDSVAAFLAAREAQGTFQSIKSQIIVPSSVRIHKTASNVEDLRASDMESMFHKPHGGPKLVSRTRANKPINSVSCASKVVFGFNYPASISMLQILTCCGGATLSLAFRSTWSAQQWHSITCATHDDTGVTTLNVVGEPVRAAEWAILVSGPGTLTDIQSIAIYGFRESPSRSIALDPYRLVEHRERLRLDAAHRTQTFLIEAVCEAPPIVMGVVLKWIQLKASASCDVPRVCISIRLEGQTILERVTITPSDLTATIPFDPQPLTRFELHVIDSSHTSQESQFSLEASCYFIHVPMECATVRIVSKASDADQLPVHLREGPSEFALSSTKSVERIRHHSLPSRLGGSQPTLRRCGSDYILALSSASHCRRLTRVSTIVCDWKGPSERAQYLKQQATLSFQGLDGNWVPCAETFVTCDGQLDFFWGRIPPDPAPMLWKISFAHLRVPLRWVNLHMIDGVAVASIDGFAPTPACRASAVTEAVADPIHRVAILSQLHAGLSPQHVALSYVGTSDRVSMLRLDVPHSVRFVCGLQFMSPKHDNSGTTMQIDGVAADDGKRILLWSGSTTSVQATWPPTRCREILITNVTTDISTIRLLLPETQWSSLGRGTGATITLHQGSQAVEVPSFPATLPLMVGSHVHIGHVSPLLFSAVRVAASESNMCFQISYLDETSSRYITVGVLSTNESQPIDVVLTPYASLPCQWRLTCCECAERSDGSQASPAFVDLDVSFQWEQPLQHASPVDLCDVPCNISTNAIARHNATSQAPLRQRFLSKMHSSAPDLQPYVRLGNFSDTTSVASDDWEKRSQVSVSSVGGGGGGTSFTPFVFIIADLRTNPRAFTSIAINAQVDAQFELSIQWSDDGQRYETVCIHAQGNGWWNSSWPAVGTHQFWRVVASFPSIGNRKSKRGQSTSFGTDIDEKLLSPYMASITSCALVNVVWSSIDPCTRSIAGPFSREDVIALRHAQLGHQTSIQGLNPLFRCAVPIGLKPPTSRTLSFDFVDAVDGVSLFALWRAACATPAPALQRAALAAEDDLQQSLPHLANPHSVLDKESSREISKWFFEDADFEMSDVSIISQTNRITNDPCVLLRGVSVSGARAIPPGTRMALSFEWVNTSLIPSQPNIFVRSMMTMERSWLSLQSEFSAFDSFSRNLPSLRTTIFKDLELYLTVYALSHDDVRFGGNFPPIPVSSPSSTPSCHGTPECVVSQGINVIATAVPVSVLTALFADSIQLNSVQSIVRSLFIGDCVATLHASFLSGSNTRLTISGMHNSRLMEDGSIVVKSMKLRIDHIGDALSVELLGDVELPTICPSGISFFLHGLLHGPADDSVSSSRNERHYTFGLVCADENSFSRALFDPDAPFTMRSVGGTVHARSSIDCDSQRDALLICDSITVHSFMRFSSLLQVPCSVCVANGHVVPGSLVVSTGPILNISRDQFVNFIEETFRSRGTTIPCCPADILDGMGGFIGSGSFTFNPRDACRQSIEFVGHTTWNGTPNLGCTVSIGVTRDSPLLKVLVAVNRTDTCSWLSSGLKFSQGQIQLETCCQRASIQAFFASLHSNSSALQVLTASIHHKLGRTSRSTIACVVPIAGQAYSVSGTLLCRGDEQIITDWNGLDEVMAAMETALVRLFPNLIIKLVSVLPVWSIDVVQWKVQGTVAGAPFVVFATINRHDTLIADLGDAIIHHSAPRTITSLI